MPFQLLLKTYDKWIALIQSLDMLDCRIADYQWETLLKIALAYRAFASGAHPAVYLNDFNILAWRLVSAVKVLGKFNRANATLWEAIDYLELHLPEVSTDHYLFCTKRTPSVRVSCTPWCACAGGWVSHAHRAHHQVHVSLSMAVR